MLQRREHGTHSSKGPSGWPARGRTLLRERRASALGSTATQFSPPSGLLEADAIAPACLSKATSHRAGAQTPAQCLEIGNPTRPSRNDCRNGQRSPSSIRAGEGEAAGERPRSTRKAPRADAQLECGIARTVGPDRDDHGGDHHPARTVRRPSYLRLGERTHQGIAVRQNRIGEASQPRPGRSPPSDRAVRAEQSSGCAPRPDTTTAAAPNARSNCMFCQKFNAVTRSPRGARRSAG
jgi:hypothetical protein